MQLMIYCYHYCQLKLGLDVVYPLENQQRLCVDSHENVMW